MFGFLSNLRNHAVVKIIWNGTLPWGRTSKIALNLQPHNSSSDGLLELYKRLSIKTLRFVINLAGESSFSYHGEANEVI